MTRCYRARHLSSGASLSFFFTPDVHGDKNPRIRRNTFPGLRARAIENHPVKETNGRGGEEGRRRGDRQPGRETWRVAMLDLI